MPLLYPVMIPGFADVGGRKRQRGFRFSLCYAGNSRHTLVFSYSINLSERNQDLGLMLFSMTPGRKLTKKQGWISGGELRFSLAAQISNAAKNLHRI